MLCLYIIPALLPALAAKWFLVANQSAGYHCKALHGIELGYLRDYICPFCVIEQSEHSSGRFNIIYQDLGSMFFVVVVPALWNSIPWKFVCLLPPYFLFCFGTCWKCDFVPKPGVRLDAKLLFIFYVSSLFGCFPDAYAFYCLIFLCVHCKLPRVFWVSESPNPTNQHVS